MSEEGSDEMQLEKLLPYRAFEEKCAKISRSRKARLCRLEDTEDGKISKLRGETSKASKPQILKFCWVKHTSVTSLIPLEPDCGF